jgi:hypothetical protein
LICEQCANSVERIASVSAGSAVSDRCSGHVRTRVCRRLEARSRALAHA